MHKIATIGFFDGVHRGHHFLFAQLLEHAKLHNLSPIIYTFVQHPKLVLTGKQPSLLTSTHERKYLLEQCAEVRMLNFAEVQHLTAEQFMRYISEKDNVQMLLMGYDHCFGSDRVKGFSEYAKIANRVGLHIERAHECLVDGIPVSSSRVRKLLDEGQMEQVNRLLGYKYTLTGKVVRGNSIGNQIGYPTANISYSPERKLPLLGVYAATVKLDGVEFPAVVNIGHNPTVGNLQISVEAHLIDFQGDLYGKCIAVSFRSFIRPERKFTSLEKLQLQIKKDIQSLDGI